VKFWNWSTSKRTKQKPRTPQGEIKKNGKDHEIGQTMHEQGRRVDEGQIQKKTTSAREELEQSQKKRRMANPPNSSHDQTLSPPHAPTPDHQKQSQNPKSAKPAAYHARSTKKPQVDLTRPPPTPKPQCHPKQTPSPQTTKPQKPTLAKKPYPRTLVPPKKKTTRKDLDNLEEQRRILKEKRKGVRLVISTKEGEIFAIT